MLDLPEETSVIKLTGSLRIVNVQDKIVAEVKVVELDEPSLIGFFSMMGPKKEDKPKLDKNEVTVELYKKIGKERLLFAVGKGNYARYLEIGGVLLTQHSKVEYPSWTIEEAGPNTLPSSSVMRKELALIKDHRFADADKWGNQRAYRIAPGREGGRREEGGGGQGPAAGLKIQ